MLATPFEPALWNGLNRMPDPSSSAQPLSPKVFHLLLALSAGSQHGYGIKKSVFTRTGGRLDLDPGGLYRLIRRLEDEGLLIETSGPAEDPSPDERRRYYALTDAGEATLAAEARRVSDVASWPEVRRLAGESGDG